MRPWVPCLYRLLLRLYPRWFRDAYAHQMEADFVDWLQAQGSPAGWGIVVRDLVSSIPREWLATLRRRRPTPAPVRSTPQGENMVTLIHDLRYGLRMFRQHPTFSALVVATLALGIGANVAMFSVVDSVLLSPLPYQDPERLVMVWNRHTATGADKVQVSGPDFVDYRLQTTSFEDFAYIHNSADNTLTGDGPAEQIDMGYVSTNFFQFLGREPMLGRAFSTDDENRGRSGLGGAAPVILSHGLWVRRFGSDPGMVGRNIYVAGRAMEVIGVMPPNFELVLPYSDVGYAAGEVNQVVDVYRILPERALAGIPRSTAILRVVGRLEPGVTVGQAQKEMDVLARRLREEYRVHGERGTSIDLLPMHADVVGGVRTIVLSLFGAVGFVLLIACANVANLILVRAANRQREVAVRTALGAHRRRLVRQLLTENAVLAVGGASLGVVLAGAIVNGIVGLAPADVPMLDGAGIDIRAVGFALGIAFVAVLLFGVWPALRGTRVAPISHLNEGPRGGMGRVHRLRSGIVTAEIALSMVLLVGGGLLVRSFLELQRAGLGFEPTSALTSILAMPHGAYDDAAVRTNYWNALRREVADAPGVEAAGLVWPLPFATESAEAPYAATGGESEDWGRYLATIANCSPGYFEAMDAKLLDGRMFTEADLARSEDIAIVDDLVAERLFPGVSAVGRKVWIQPLGSEERKPREIVGVIEHIRHTNVAGPDREVIHVPTVSAYRMALVVRTRSHPEAAVSELRGVAAALDPDIPLVDTRTFAEYLESEIAPTRFTMTLASVLAVVALVMAAVGLYGVISYSVSQRAAEIGVRVALGAHDGAILRLVMRDGATMAGMGIVVGLGVALAVTRTIQSLLVGIAPTDALTFVVVALVLMLVTLVASYIPARRAALLDPLESLRQE